VKTIIIPGKLPPPFMGTSVWFDTLIKSDINKYIDLVPFDVMINKDLKKIGHFSLIKVIKNIGLYWKYYIICRQKKPDLAIIPISQSTIGFLKDSFFIYISKLLKIRVAVILHGGNLYNWLSGQPFFIKKFVIYTLKRGCAGIVLGENLRYLFRGIFPEERIFVLPNGKDFKYHPFDRKEGKFRLLYLGNLQPSKGIQDVIEAFSIIQTTCDEDNIELDVVGLWRDEEVKQECFDIKGKFKLKINFHDVKIGEEKNELLLNSDIFVFTPRAQEGHPFVIIEALASGLAIIATDKGAITESVLHGWNGFIVNPQKPAEIAEKIMQLYNDPELRKKMAERSREHYLKNYTEQKMVQRYIECIDKILNGQLKIIL
jgi:glycosyltransferase involved in cell wall biosynthesis